MASFRNKLVHVTSTIARWVPILKLSNLMKSILGDFLDPSHFSNLIICINLPVFASFPVFFFECCWELYLDDSFPYIFEPTFLYIQTATAPPPHPVQQHKLPITYPCNPYQMYVLHTDHQDCNFHAYWAWGWCNQFFFNKIGATYCSYSLPYVHHILCPDCKHG